MDGRSDGWWTPPSRSRAAAASLGAQRWRLSRYMKGSKGKNIWLKTVKRHEAKDGVEAEAESRRHDGGPFKIKTRRPEVVIILLFDIIHVCFCFVFFFSSSHRFMPFLYLEGPLCAWLFDCMYILKRCKLFQDSLDVWPFLNPCDLSIWDGFTKLRSLQSVHTFFFHVCGLKRPVQLFPVLIYYCYKDASSAFITQRKLFRNV